MRLDPQQLVVVEHYADGEFAWIAEDSVRSSDFRDMGDSLFTFLMSELSETEDCEGANGAVQRLDTAIEQLQILRSKFEGSL